MSISIEFHGWRFSANSERTRAAYAASSRRGAEDCSCPYCRNLVAQRAHEYPSELLEFLRSAGVDPFKEAEVWEAGPFEDGSSFNAGWWHFIASVEREGEDAIQLKPEAGSRARDWLVSFLPSKRDLRLETLPDEPLVQIEFSVTLPWVLTEPYPTE